MLKALWRAYRDNDEKWASSNKRTLFQGIIKTAKNHTLWAGRFGSLSGKIIAWRSVLNDLEL